MVALMLFAIESHSNSHREWPNSRVQPDPPEGAFFFANASGGGPVNPNLLRWCRRFHDSVGQFSSFSAFALRQRAPFTLLTCGGTAGRLTILRRLRSMLTGLRSRFLRVTYSLTFIFASI